MKDILPTAILSALLPSTAQALVGLTRHFPNQPDSGLPDLTFPISVPNAPHQHGFYFAQQFSLVNGSAVGYTGLQPQVDSNGAPVIRALFSSFIDGAKSTDDNCSDGADSGAGVSCAVYISDNYSGTYNLEVKNVGTDTWQGTAIHLPSGSKTHIGTYTVPAGSGMLEGYQLGFVEYFPWNSEENICNKLPYTDVTFGVPTTTLTGAGDGAYENTPYEYGSCVGKVNFMTEDISGAQRVQVGFK